MDKWNEWKQSYKGQEGRIGNTLLKGTHTTHDYTNCHFNCEWSNYTSLKSKGQSEWI